MRFRKLVGFEYQVSARTVIELCLTAILTISIVLGTRSLNQSKKVAETETVGMGEFTPATFTGESVANHPTKPTKPRKMSFVRDKYLHDSPDLNGGIWAQWIYVFELSTRKERRIVEGRDPSLSPDGDAIAFTSDLSSHATTIRVIDLKTKKIRSFASLDQHNAFDAQWSADGTKLAFNVQSDKRDGIGVLNVLDGQWKSITKDLDLGLKGSGVFLDSWVGSDNAVLCHDLDFVYEVRVDGTLLQKLPIERLFDKGQTSGRTRYSFSSEKTYLLFDAMEDPTKGWIYIVDLSKQRVSRISPNTIFAEEPMWLPSEKEILFTCFYKSNPSIGNICKIRTDGTGLIILVRNARSASYSVK